MTSRLRPKPEEGVRAGTDRRADLADADSVLIRRSTGPTRCSRAGSEVDVEVGITLRGTRAIVQAMQATNVRRIVVVSAAPVSTVPSPGRPNPPKHDPGEGFFMRNMLSPFIKAVLRKHYADLALMEDTLRDSGLDWTVVRPPRLTDRPKTGAYRTAYEQTLRRGIVVSRADVAHLMLRVLDQPETIKKAIGIAN